MWLSTRSECSVSTPNPYTQGALAVIGLIWLLMQATVAQGNNADQRLLNAMGTIFCDGKIRGSAVHISLSEKSAPDDSVILSAAHIMFDPNSGKAFKSCQYRPQNKRFSGLLVEAFSTAHYEASGSDKLAQANNDIVLLKPKHRLYQSTLAVSDNGAANSGKLLLVAYSSDLDRITLSEPCTALVSKQPVSKHLLLHDCGAQAGTSGGAIVDTSSGKIVAIHGGALVFNSLYLSHKRDQIDPRMLVNQGRIIDRQIIENFSGKNTES